MSSNEKRSLEDILQNTLNSINSGELGEPFTNETITITDGTVKTVDVPELSGFYLPNGDIYFDPRTDSAKRYTEALNKLRCKKK